VNNAEIINAERVIVASLMTSATNEAARNAVNACGLTCDQFTDTKLGALFRSSIVVGATPGGMIDHDTHAETIATGDADQLAKYARAIIEYADPARPYLEALRASDITFETADRFTARSIPEPDWIVQGFIARGMKGDLPAPSKMRKTFFAMQLAESIAAGRDFCGTLKVSKPRRVLYCNLELMKFFAQERMRLQIARPQETPEDGDQSEVGQGLDIPVERLRNLTIANLRGKGSKLREAAVLGAFVKYIKARAFDFVIIDPQYKLM